MPSTRTDITLRNLPVDEDLIHAIRDRCENAAARAGRGEEPWTIVVERSHPVRRGPVLVRATACVGTPAVLAAAEAPDPFLAVRDAFALLLDRLTTG